MRLYKALADERKGWMQRIHATLFHQGVPALACHLLDLDGQAHLDKAELSPAGRQLVEVALRQIDHLEAELSQLRTELVAFGRQVGCRAIQSHYGIEALLSVAIWEELGDCRRFSSSSDAVRHTGLDVTVWSSDSKRSKGHLARQGRRFCDGRFTRPVCRPPNARRPTTITSTKSGTALVPLVLRSRLVESWGDAAITRFANWATTPWHR